MRGYFGIGVYHIKNEVNIGTLWRSAYSFGANHLFTIGKRYEKQCSDTTKAWRHVPLFHYKNFGDLSLPVGCKLVCIEIGGESLNDYTHPERAIYLLGAEDDGIPEEILSRCHDVIAVPMIRPYCLNVSVAGSIVMFDRIQKLGKMGKL